MQAAVRIPNDLLVAAKAATTETGLGVAAQIETWVRLGRFFEQLASQVQQGARDIRVDPSTLHGILNVQLTLDGLTEVAGRPTLDQQLLAMKFEGPCYEADPEDPEGVVRWQHGSRSRGRFENGVFVEATAGVSQS